MSSDLLTAILCPNCGKNLEVWWSRNDIAPIAHCSQCTYQTDIKNLTLLYLKQYYIQKEGVVS